MKATDALKYFSEKRKIALTPADFARIVERLDTNERLRVLNNISLEDLIDIVSELSNRTNYLFFTSISPKKSSKIISLLPPDERADILQLLPPNIRIKIIDALDEKIKKETLSLLKYEPSSAGGLMTTQFLAFPKEMRVKDVIRTIRSRKKKHYIYYVYVVDSDGKLVGVVSMRDLLLANSNEKLENIMRRNVIKVLHSASAKEVVRLIKDNNLLAIPVTDEDGKLLGIVTADDAMDVMESETAREMDVMAGVSPLENVISARVVSLAKARLPALLFGFIGTMLMVYVVSSFETTLQKYLPLAFFMPLLVYLSDAAGTQSESMTIRALALDPKLSLSRYILKQFKSGIIISTVLALFCYAIASLIWGFKFGIAIGLALFISINFSNLVASLLPILYKRVLKVDPAGISGPLDTILSDISTLIIYFLVASLLI